VKDVRSPINDVREALCAEILTVVEDGHFTDRMHSVFSSTISKLICLAR